MALKEVKVPNTKGIYRIYEISPSGKETKTERYRVRKRVKINGKWTIRGVTFYNFEEARIFSKTAYDPLEKYSETKSGLFKEAFDRFLNHQEHRMKLTQSTLQIYRSRRRHLLFFEEMSVTDINPKVVDTWLELLDDPQYLRNQQASRINYEKEYVVLSAFFRYFRNYENENFTSPLLDRHRKRATARSKQDIAEIRYLSSEEEDIFLASLTDDQTIQDIALFQLHTGARVGEAAALDFKFINFSKGEVRIAQHLDWERIRNGKITVKAGTKSGPQRVVPLTEECLAMLKRRQKETNSNIVFRWDRNDSWLPYRIIQHKYDKAFRNSGIELSGTHCLRHTFAVRFLDQTKDIYALQKALGHSDLTQTQHYAKYSNESVRQAFKGFKVVNNVRTLALVP